MQEAMHGLHVSKTKYADPDQRPQLKNSNKRPINTKIQSQSRSVQKALGIGSKKKQSSFMKNINRPLIQNQIKEDLLSAFMQLIYQERLIEQSKLRLIMHADFNLFDAFKIFDQLARGSLTLSELNAGLINHLGLVPT